MSFVLSRVGMKRETGKVKLGAHRSGTGPCLGPSSTLRKTCDTCLRKRQQGEKKKRWEKTDMKEREGRASYTDLSLH